MKKRARGNQFGVNRAVCSTLQLRGAQCEATSKMSAQGTINIVDDER